jgi:DNA mismatch endonuclease, patch repair protein
VGRSHTFLANGNAVADTVTKIRRSEIMASVGQKNTKPELVVRSFLHRKGLRYRLHAKELPGKPDLVFPRLKAVLFVNGCFWHGHQNQNCKLARTPKSNVDFWVKKVETNRERDHKNWALLKELGWTVIVIWECELSNFDRLNEIYRELT